MLPPDKPDHYNTLLVSQRATLEEIKQAYKNLARHIHPDKNRDSDAHEEFCKLKDAYDTLKDAFKRRIYDNEYPGILARWNAYQTWERNNKNHLSKGPNTPHSARRFPIHHSSPQRHRASSPTFHRTPSPTPRQRRPPSPTFPRPPSPEFSSYFEHIWTSTESAERLEKSIQAQETFQSTLNTLNARIAPLKSQLSAHQGKLNECISLPDPPEPMLYDHQSWLEVSMGWTPQSFEEAKKAWEREKLRRVAAQRVLQAQVDRVAAAISKLEAEAEQLNAENERRIEEEEGEMRRQEDLKRWRDLEEERKRRAEEMEDERSRPFVYYDHGIWSEQELRERREARKKREAEEALARIERAREAAREASIEYEKRRRAGFDRDWEAKKEARRAELQREEEERVARERERKMREEEAMKERKKRQFQRQFYARMNQLREEERKKKEAEEVRRAWILKEQLKEGVVVGESQVGSESTEDGSNEPNSNSNPTGPVSNEAGSTGTEPTEPEPIDTTDTPSNLQTLEAESAALETKLQQMAQRLQQALHLDHQARTLAEPKSPPNLVPPRLSTPLPLSTPPSPIDIPSPTNPSTPTQSPKPVPPLPTFYNLPSHQSRNSTTASSTSTTPQTSPVQPRASTTTTTTQTSPVQSRTSTTSTHRKPKPNLAKDLPPPPPSANTPVLPRTQPAMTMRGGRASYLGTGIPAMASIREERGGRL